MSPTECPTPDELLAFHRGEADEAAIDRIAAHLSTCPYCEAVADTLERIGDPILSALRRPGPVAADDPNARPPERLGPFKLTDRLGAGGMGVVYRGVDEQLGRPVAVKVLKPGLAGDPDQRRRFLSEARATAAVRHPNVVNIFQVGVDAGMPFLAMELLTGESLEQRLRRQAPLPTAETLTVAAQVARGLAAAHAAGLIHRDVKPDNIFLTPDGTGVRVTLLDFGLARSAEPAAGLTNTGVVVGTPGYMAPEQVRGDPVTARTDLFALGCVLYRMCAGVPPFPGATVLAVLSALETHDPPPPRRANPAVPPLLDALVTRLLRKDPAGRPPSADAVAEALDGIAAGRRPAAGSFAAELARDAVRTTYRRAVRRTAAGLAVAVAAVVVAAVRPGTPVVPPAPPPPVEITVTSLRDEPTPGETTLREAIERANQHATAVVVTVAPAGELLLGGPLPEVRNPALEVRGPGADRLTVRPAPAAGRMGVFVVSPGAELTLADLTVAGGHAKNGGGVLNDGGRLALRRCVVAGCQADEYGGGVYSSGPLRADDCTFHGNTGWWHGGGVYADGTAGGEGVALTHCTLSGNRAKRYGGGLVLHGTRDARVTGCTVTLNRCNLEGNDPGTHGGGLRLLVGTAVLTNTILAHNFRGTAVEPRDLLTNDGLRRALAQKGDMFDDISLSPGAATRLAGGHNLIGLLSADSSMWVGLPGDRVGRPGSPLDPDLGPLRANGGPTPTHAPRPGSPAIDAGSPADLPPTDQRGRPRVAGPAPDVGAVEAGS